MKNKLYLLSGIAVCAIALAFIPLDDAGVAISDQMTNEDEFDANAELLAEEQAAAAAAQEIIDASQSNAGGTSLTTDEMLNQIEGVN